MIDHVQKVLKDIKRVVPGLRPEAGVRAGRVRLVPGVQRSTSTTGRYPDRMKPGGYDEYAELLGHLIRDVRKDLAAPKLPFVIGVMGIGGEKGERRPRRCTSARPREADDARRVQGERGGGGDRPVLGRRPGRAATSGWTS